MALIKTIILFDGVCNLCNHSVTFIQKRDKKEQFRYVALQSEEGERLSIEFQIPPTTDSIIVIHRSKAFTASEAIVKIIQLLPTPWKWFAVFGIIPKNRRDKIYGWVAKNRYRWFGKIEKCTVADYQ
ncbi:DUF393 domain-containing protein [Prolixibacteraceae bacterium Z1-6]|uniref:DUF393 domain-containing protein n=1 Tax=Draconibacterium aestuarii TaxID=2998507 RepID=A0A9X3J4Q1_9BACT|nr:DUF393 domain-containing protein [Prolixibacteraceae bacterium Z1-6]